MKKRNILKKLKQVAIKESLKHKDEGIVTIGKSYNKKHLVVRIKTNTSRKGILIDRLKPPFHTWTLPMDSEVKR